MLTGLKRYVYAPIAALALWAVVLAASPATATAQATSLAKDPQVTNRGGGGAAAERVVVALGDSLWSISAQWLGPNATTRQIADGVERIYTLNQKRIGSSPELIFTGQRLLLPPAVERQSPESGLGRAAPAREAAEPTAPSPASRAAKNGSVTAAEAAVGEADHKARQVPDARSQPASLPEPARAAPVSAIGSLIPNDFSPSLAKSVTSEARSAFSAVVRAAGEAFPREDHSGRNPLGWALIAMCSALAIIVALHVARVGWGHWYAERRTRERWVRETLGTNYASLDTFAPRDGYAAASAAFESHPSERGSQEAAKPAPLEELQQRAVAEQSGNGSDPSDGVRRHAGFAAIARSEQARLRRARMRPAWQSPRGSGALARQGRARRATPRTMSRRKMVSRRKVVSDNPKVPDIRREWDISEPLRRSLESFPLQPSAQMPQALSEMKPQVEGELRTLALLKQRRRLSDRERRQESALRDLLALIEER